MICFSCSNHLASLLSLWCFVQKIRCPCHVHMVEAADHVWILSQTNNLIYFGMSFMVAGSPPNARCSLSCQCNAILHECSAKHKVCALWYKVLFTFLLRDHSVVPLLMILCGFAQLSFWCSYPFLIYSPSSNLWFKSFFDPQGEERLCSVLITSRTNNSGSECSRTRRWG